MKRFSCGDVVPGCAASWVCSSEDELLAHVAAHASSAHGIDEVTPELLSAVRSHLVDLS